MQKEKTIEDLIKELDEINREIYINEMRLKSIEANFWRVAPYSAEFDCLMNKALQIKDELGGRIGGLYCKKLSLEYRINMCNFTN